MIKRTILFIFLFFSIIISQYAQGQKWAIVDKQSNKSDINIISIDGEKIWSIPSKHHIQVGQTTSQITSFMFKSYKFFDFSKSDLPVKSKDGWYLMDYNGNKIIDFKNKYSRVQPATDGLYRAYELIPNKRGSSMIIYLDKKGNQAINGNKYWEATEFSEGLAIVQLDDKNGPWLIINKKGEKVGEFPEKYSKYIMSSKSFKDGLALVTLKRPRGYDRKSFVYQKIYFDRKGNEIIDVAKISKTHKNNRSISFNNGIAYCIQNNNYIFYNKLGEKLHEFRNILGIKSIVKEYIYINNGTYFNNLFDKNFNPVKLNLNTNEIAIIDYLSDEYIGAVVFDTLQNKKKSTYNLYNAENLNKAYETNKNVIGVLDNKILIGEQKGYDTKLVAIEDLNHNTIYSLSPKNRLFTSIEEALPFKNEVQYLELDNEKNFDKVIEFKNLKTLKLYNFKNQKLSENFERLAKLELFSVSNFNNLEKLPHSLSKISTLKELHVSDCKKISGIEEIIPLLKNLTRVYTHNYSFKKGFTERLETERPNLKIDNWTSFGDTFEEVMDMEIDNTSPPPPPPPSPSPTKKNK